MKNVFIIILAFILLGCYEKEASAANDKIKFDSNGYTPLMRAVKVGDLKETRALLKEGLEINDQNKNGSSAMSLAITFQHVEILQYLLNKGGDPNLYNPIRGEPLIFRAIMSTNFEIVKLLVDGGADVNLRDWNNDTPLISAITLKQYRIAVLLLEQGANPELINKSGQSVKDVIAKGQSLENPSKNKWEKKLLSILNK